VKKLLRALQAIKDYTTEKQPKTAEEARHMLALVSVIATETIAEHDAHESPKPSA